MKRISTKPKVFFFVKVNKIDKHLGRPREEKEKAHIIYI